MFTSLMSSWRHSFQIFVSLTHIFSVPFIPSDFFQPTSLHFYLVGGLPCQSTLDKTTHLDRHASALDNLVVQLAARRAPLEFVSLWDWQGKFYWQQYWSIPTSLLRNISMPTFLDNYLVGGSNWRLCTCVSMSTPTPMPMLALLEDCLVGQHQTKPPTWTAMLQH